MSAPFRLIDVNTRFALRILDPRTGEEVSAETLYNRCCDDTGRVVRDHIADLVFDNFDYGQGDGSADLTAKVIAWEENVRRFLNEYDKAPINSSVHAFLTGEGMYTAEYYRSGGSEPYDIYLDGFGDAVLIAGGKPDELYTIEVVQSEPVTGENWGVKFRTEDGSMFALNERMSTDWRPEGRRFTRARAERIAFAIDQANTSLNIMASKAKVFSWLS
jgi:hypothetical protein